MQDKGFITSENNTGKAGEEMQCSEESEMNGPALPAWAATAPIKY